MLLLSALSVALPLCTLSSGLLSAGLLLPCAWVAVAAF